MPVAESRLEILQARKLIQCVRLKDSAQIAKLVQLGIPGLINYQGELSGVYVYNEPKKIVLNLIASIDYGAIVSR